MTKYILYKYTAESDFVPENYYQYASENGSGEVIWIFDDLLKAMSVLSEYESTCEMNDKEGRYEVVCYALEKEEAGE